MVSLTAFIQEYYVAASQDDGVTQYLSKEYRCCDPLNVYDSPQLTSLATQAAPSRQLRILSLPPCSPHLSEVDRLNDSLKNNTVKRTNPDPAPVQTALPVCLCEDDYPGWIAITDLEYLEPAVQPYTPPVWTAAAIGDRIPAVIEYLQAAMGQPNHYFWGGTIGPNFDCSGLMQAAFQSVGIWIPRDADQQELFIQPVSLEPSWQHLQPGDLVFFGPQGQTNHVAFYLGDRQYIHSSGTAMGRNGIGIDVLSQEGDKVSQAYLARVHGAGRVVSSYQPAGIPLRSIRSWQNMEIEN